MGSRNGRSAISLQRLMAGLKPCVPDLLPGTELGPYCLGMVTSSFQGPGSPHLEEEWFAAQRRVTCAGAPDTLM